MQWLNQEDMFIDVKKVNGRKRVKIWKPYYRVVTKISFSDSAIYCLELKKK